MTELNAFHPGKRFRMELYKGLNNTNRIKAMKTAVINGFIIKRKAARTKTANAAKKYLANGV